MSQVVALKLRGHYLGCDPLAPVDVHADRLTAGVWEWVELTKRDDGRYLARFIAADRAISVDDGGRLTTRTAGTAGPWEVWHGAELPPDWRPVLVSVNGVVLEVVR